VWETLVPSLERAGVRVAVSDDVAEPGVARVVNAERGIRRSQRTVVVLTEAYLTDRMAEFENVLAQTMGVDEGRHRLIPVKAAPFDPARLPTRLSMLTAVDLTRPERAGRELDRLVRALRPTV
jgi:flagellar biosynthesis/type III secretory pathway M-ring protein FliF/YscJ